MEYEYTEFDVDYTKTKLLFATFRLHLRGSNTTKMCVSESKLVHVFTHYQINDQERGKYIDVLI